MQEIQAALKDGEIEKAQEIAKELNPTVTEDLNQERGYVLTDEEVATTTRVANAEREATRYNNFRRLGRR